MTDLHMHSLASDGLFHPEELYKMVKEAGVTKFALTDHDNIDGVKILEKREMDIKFIPGIEITCERINGKEIHIVGLGINTNCKELNDYTKYVINDLNIRNNKLYEEFNKCGVEIARKDLDKYTINDNLSRTEITYFLIDNGIVKDQDEAFRRFYRTERFSEIRRNFEGLKTKDAINLIHKAGGKAILAHIQKLKLTDEESDKLVSKLKSEGLDAMECFHGKMTKKETINACKLANKYNLHKSIGSDFHGKNKNKNLKIGKGIDNILLEGKDEDYTWI